MSANPLAELLQDPAFLRYLGRSVEMKLEIFATIRSGGGNLSEIARRHGVSKQAAHKLALKARAVLGQTPG